MPAAVDVRRLWQRAPGGLRVPVSVVIQTFQHFIEDSCGTYAAAIAYYAIFSLVPLSIVVLSPFGLVVDRAQIVDFVFEQVPLRDTADVKANVDEVVQRAQEFSVASLSFGIVTLVWSGSGIFAAVRRGLNAASHRTLPRPYWRAKLLDFAFVPLLGLLIILALALSAVAQVAIERAGSIGELELNTNGAVRMVSYVVPALFTFAMFTVLYRVVPTVPPQIAEALAGAFFATVLFETAKNIYATVFAMTPFSTDTAVYASFGTALAFLLWMFINASILLLGAEFARALAAVSEQQRAPRRAAVPEPGAHHRAS